MKTKRFRKLPNSALGFCLFAASLFASQAHAQADFWHTPIELTNVNLRGAPVVLGQLNVSVPSTGRMIVQFDGYGVVSVGDRIVLAASNTTGWGVNDGNVGIEAYNTDQNRRPFSHTRSYVVGPGNHTFYAIGENFVETAGTGFGSIYGSLNVKFYPDTPAGPRAIHRGIVDVGVDVRGAPVSLEEILFVSPGFGRVTVRFDGQIVSSPGDQIVLAASNFVGWQVNSGNTGAKAFDSDLNTTSFSHTRVYAVGPGPSSFHAIAENYVELGGSGVASIYGSLTVEYFPLALGQPTVAIFDISETNVNFFGAPVTVGQLDLTFPYRGDVLLRYDALGYTSVGDRIAFAASNVPDWSPNSGQVSVEAVDADLDFMPFSHSRRYAVGPGPQSFYAVGENFVEVAGTGFGSTYGHLTAQFFPVPEPSVVLGVAVAGLYLAGLARRR